MPTNYNNSRARETEREVKKDLLFTCCPVKVNEMPACTLEFIYIYRYNIYMIVYLQVEPGKPGAEVSKKKTISQRKNLPIECAQGDQPRRCPKGGILVRAILGLFRLVVAGSVSVVR